MKMRFWMMGLTAFLAMGFAATATTYYIDDGSNEGDVYTPGYTGNESNDGLSPSSPKRTINNLLAATNLLPGDVVLIDTGTYTNNVIIGTNVNGMAGNPIVFQGSTTTRPWGGGTIFNPTGGNVFDIRGRYLHFRDIQAVGGGVGFNLTGSSFGEYERIYCISNNANGVSARGASNSNAFRRCVFRPISFAGISSYAPVKGNYLENSISWAPNSIGIISESGAFSNIVGNILLGQYASAGGIYAPSAASYNLLWGSVATVSLNETLAELQRINTNWHHNTVADPKFANPEGFDFHLLSAAGFVSNGVWVTNAAVGYSPGIDFGARE